MKRKPGTGSVYPIRGGARWIAQVKTGPRGSVKVAQRIFRTQEEAIAGLETLPLHPGRIEAFWAKVDKEGPNGCWIWTRGRHKLGYGYYYGPDGYTSTHRFAYQLVIGPIPEGLELDHLCRNPSCCNPAHLEAVTHQENVRRGRAGYKAA